MTLRQRARRVRINPVHERARILEVPDSIFSRDPVLVVDRSPRVFGHDDVVLLEDRITRGAPEGLARHPGISPRAGVLIRRFRSTIGVEDYTTVAAREGAVVGTHGGSVPTILTGHEGRVAALIRAHA